MIGYFGSKSCSDKQTAIALLTETLSSVLTDHLPVAIDTETVSLKDRTIIGWSLATNKDEGFWFSKDEPDAPLWLLSNPHILKAFYNCMYDLEVLRQICEPDAMNIVDVFAMARQVNEFGTLAENSLRHGLEAHSFSELIGSGKTMLDVDISVVAKKCCQDAQATIGLYYEYLDEADPKALSEDMAVIPVLLDMGRKGVALDNQRAQNLSMELERETEFYKSVCEGQGFNPGSPSQVAYMLSKRGYWLPMTKSKRSLSSAEEVLIGIDDPVAQMVLRYREVSYQLSHYVKPACFADSFHTRYSLEAATGRISSAEPNLQNIPQDRPRNRFRGLIRWEAGSCTKVDYSQMQLRILAEFSQDREMLRIYSEGGDIHQETADFIPIDRTTAKTVNFAMVFLAGVKTLAYQAHCTERRAAELIERWSRKYYGAWEWIQEQKKQGLRYGYVHTLGGRKLWITTQWIEDKAMQGHIERCSVNYPIQGSEAEIVKRAMRLVWDKGLDLRLQVHDELVFNGKVVVPDISRLGSLYTPTETKYLESWE